MTSTAATRNTPLIRVNVAAAAKTSTSAHRCFTAQYQAATANPRNTDSE